MSSLRLAHSAQPGPRPQTTPLALFEREIHYIFETLQRLGAARTDVEDLAQELFVVLLRNWSIVDTTRPLRPYLFGIAFRIVSSYRRRRRRETPFDAMEVEDGAPDPDSTLRDKQSVDLLHEALNQVPMRRRAAIIMHELDGIPVVEVARRLSISQFGAYARLRKGRRELAAAVRRLSKERLGE